MSQFAALTTIGVLVGVELSAEILTISEVTPTGIRFTLAVNSARSSHPNWPPPVIAACPRDPSASDGCPSRQHKLTCPRHPHIT